MTAYHRIAPFYDKLFEPFNTGLRRAALRAWPPEAGQSALDIGCGTGALLADLAAAGCRVSGVDLSEAMLEQARKKLGADAELHCTSATELPFADASFDLVTSTLMLHELRLDVREGIAREAWRVLRPEGRVLLVDFHPAPYSVGGWLRRPMLVATELVAGWEHFRNHLDFLRRGGLPALAAAAAFEVDKLRPVAGGTLAIALLKKSG